MKEDEKPSGEEMRLHDLEKDLYSKPEGSITFKNRMKKAGKKIADWYFKPKRFEESGELYEALGVRWFNEHWPNSPTYRRKKGLYLEPIPKGFWRRKDVLKSYIKHTKKIESVHLGTLPFFAGKVAYDVANGHFVSAAIFGVIGTAVNFHPIITQRYYRNKANRIIDAFELRENYKSKMSQANYLNHGTNKIS